MSIAGGVVSILDWLKDKLPISNRLESIKNQIIALETEKEKLLNGPASVKSSKRLVVIDAKLKLLSVRLQNACNAA